VTEFVADVTDFLFRAKVPIGTFILFARAETDEIRRNDHVHELPAFK
jgi:hypothetical protein